MNENEPIKIFDPIGELLLWINSNTKLIYSSKFTTDYLSETYCAAEYIIRRLIDIMRYAKAQQINVDIVCENEFQMSNGTDFNVYFAFGQYGSKIIIRSYHNSKYMNIYLPMGLGIEKIDRILDDDQKCWLILQGIKL